MSATSTDMKPSASNSSLHLPAMPSPAPPQRRRSPHQRPRHDTIVWKYEGTQHVTGVDIDIWEHPKSFFSSFFRAVLATALFRCWHLILFFTVEAVVVTYVCENVKNISFNNTLMNVLGTFIGFVISLRTSASFERYNEGRRYWSQIVHHVRMFSRTVWFHVPDEPLGNYKIPRAKDIKDFRARTLVEKKTALNLLEGFCVAVKHYLRGEDGRNYTDLWHLVKFLPEYSLPGGIGDATNASADFLGIGRTQSMQSVKRVSTTRLPLPATSPNDGVRFRPNAAPSSPKLTATGAPGLAPAATFVDTPVLLPARNPPPYGLFDFFPFSLCVRSLQMNGKEVKGRRALREKAVNRGMFSDSHNLPLEITLYLSSYVAKLQGRGLDGNSVGQLLGSMGQLVDALTGLERILTTPIPFSYSVHLWSITIIYLTTLPFQLWPQMQWFTIPGMAVATFAFCGLVKAGEEIEQPFGYDWNDLNMDHFTQNIIHRELQALTSLPTPDSDDWAFSPENDNVFGTEFEYLTEKSEPHQHPRSASPYHLSPEDAIPIGVKPEDWVKRGEKDMRAALEAGVEARGKVAGGGDGIGGQHAMLVAGAITAGYVANESFAASAAASPPPTSST